MCRLHFNNWTTALEPKHTPNILHMDGLNSGVPATDCMVTGITCLRRCIKIISQIEIILDYKIISVH